MLICQYILENEIDILTNRHMQVAVPLTFWTTLRKFA